MSTSSILVVEDDVALSEALEDTLSTAGYKVMTAVDGHMALAVLKESQIDLVVSDINMPKMDGNTLLRRVTELYPKTPVMLMTAYGTIEQAVSAIRYGAVDYLVKPFEAEVLVNMVARYIPQSMVSTGEMIAVAELSVKLAALASKVAMSDATVMITGESGVGKEVLAQYIHQHSDRKDKPFVAINCAAIPENMLEATLFGYDKGAYTGAYKSSPGKFEQAQGGTLLLDEISEMDLGLQVKLLRVLQEREVERLGGSGLIELDVRVIATSNRDIKQTVSEGKFREDLFYRLNVFPLNIPPLRERVEDIIPLAVMILQKNAKQKKQIVASISAEAKDILMKYEWPGNIRELDNVMQRAQILHNNNEIKVEDLHFESPNCESVSPQNAAVERTDSTLNGDLKKREWDVILSTIKDVKGSRKATAEKLGISQRTLRYKLANMRDAGISIPDTSGMEIT
jgi:two-component system response regulator FlrC